MQTFVPVSDSYAASVAVLDRSRLGKQRVETLQLITAITGLAFPNAREIAAGHEPGRIFDRGPKRAWQRHPAALMWSQDVFGLVCYQRATCAEWANRGHKDTCLEKTEALLDEFSQRRTFSLSEWPNWWGDERVHDSHKANLVRKDPGLYGPMWYDVEPAEGYFWPTYLKETG